MSKRNYTLPALVAFVFVLVSVISIGVVLIWREVLDPEKDGLEHKIDLTALNQLNLIIGFLYVNLIQTSLSKWRKTTKLLNNFAIDAATLVIYNRKFEQIITELKEALDKLLTSQNFIQNLFGCGLDDTEQLKHLSKVTRLTIELIEKTSNENNIIKQLARSIKNSVESMDRDYFEKDPSWFKYHLNLLLILYFGSIPAQLYNSYGFEGCLIIYPIMMYVLFSVVLWANAFHSPLDHPELQPRFDLLQRRFGGLLTSKKSRMYYNVNKKGEWSFKI